MDHVLRWRVKRGTFEQVREAIDKGAKIVEVAYYRKFLFELAAIRNNKEITKLILEEFSGWFNCRGVLYSKRMFTQCIINDNTELLERIINLFRGGVDHFPLQFALAVKLKRKTCLNMMVDRFRYRIRNSHYYVSLSGVEPEFIFLLAICHYDIRACRIESWLDYMVRELGKKDKFFMYQCLAMISDFPNSVHLLEALKRSEYYDEEYDRLIRDMPFARALAFYPLKELYNEDVIKYILSFLFIRTNN